MLSNAAQGTAFGTEKKYKIEMIVLLNFIYPPSLGLLDMTGQTFTTRGTLVQRQHKGKQLHEGQTATDQGTMPKFNTSREDHKRLKNKQQVNIRKIFAPILKLGAHTDVSKD